MEDNKAFTKQDFDEWATTTKETLNSIEQNMVTKSDILSLATKSELAGVKADVASAKTEILSSVDALTKRITDILDKDYPAQKKRISRIDFRTKRLLGKKLDKTDAAFEEQYQGEQELAHKEAGG